MAQPDRETVYAALQSLLVAQVGQGGVNPTFQSIQRRFLSILNADANAAPYLLQVQAGEQIQVQKGLPAVRTFTIHLYVYAFFTAEDTAVPDIVLNGLVTALEGALAVQPTNYFQQLGIPVSSVLIKGKIEYADQSSISGQWSLAVVPVEIVATY